jgi:hypothetical protein
VTRKIKLDRHSRSKSKTEPTLLDQLSKPLRDFVSDFKTHGANVLERVRQENPEKYLELSTKLVSLIATLKPEADGLHPVWMTRS